MRRRTIATNPQWSNCLICAVVAGVFLGGCSYGDYEWIFQQYDSPLEMWLESLPDDGPPPTCSPGLSLPTDDVGPIRWFLPTDGRGALVVDERLPSLARIDSDGDFESYLPDSVGLNNHDEVRGLSAYQREDSGDWDIYFLSDDTLVRHGDERTDIVGLVGLGMGDGAMWGVATHSIRDRHERGLRLWQIEGDDPEVVDTIELPAELGEVLDAGSEAEFSEVGVAVNDGETWLSFNSDRYSESYLDRWLVKLDDDYDVVGAWSREYGSGCSPNGLAFYYDQLWATPSSQASEISNLEGI